MVVLAIRLVPTLGLENAVGSTRVSRALWNSRKVVKPGTVVVAKAAVPRLQQLPIRPVLKHGPRSLACARVKGWKTPRRNESEFQLRSFVRRRISLPLYVLATLADSERTR